LDNSDPFLQRREILIKEEYACCDDEDKEERL